MSRKTVVFVVLVVLVVVILVFCGFAVGYIKSLEKTIEIDVRTQCYVLKLESLRWARMPESSGIAGLIDAAEMNCEGWASFIKVYEPYSSSGTKLMITDALSEWEKARTRLAELRTSYEEESGSAQIEGQQP